MAVVASIINMKLGPHSGSPDAFQMAAPWRGGQGILVVEGPNPLGFTILFDFFVNSLVSGTI